MAWAYWVTGERVLAWRCQSDRVARRVCWRRRVCRGTGRIRALRPRGTCGPDTLRGRDSGNRLHPSTDRGHVAFDRLAGGFGLSREADAEKPPDSVVVGQAIVISVVKTSVGLAVSAVAYGYTARLRDVVGDRGDGPLSTAEQNCTGDPTNRALLVEHYTAAVNSRTFGSKSGLGRPSTVAAQPMRSGRRPNNTKTCPSRSGPGWRPASTRHPQAAPGFSAAEGAVMPSACSRCRQAACWHAGQVSGPPISVSRGRSGRCDGISPISTAQRARRTVERSCGSRISSCRRNSAQAPSGVSHK